MQRSLVSASVLSLNWSRCLDGVSRGLLLLPLRASAADLIVGGPGVGEKKGLTSTAVRAIGRRVSGCPYNGLITSDGRVVAETIDEAPALSEFANVGQSGGQVERFCFKEQPIAWPGVAATPWLPL